jgi:chromosome partitioning protein
LITPLNDSFVDLDVLAVIDPLAYAITGESHYAEAVREARRHRRLIDGGVIDWIVVRNRLSVLSSHNKQLVGQSVNELAARLGFRCVDGLAERVIYRELFPRGLTVLDSVDEIAPGTRPSASHQTARQEVTSLIEGLQLPRDISHRRHAAARVDAAKTGHVSPQAHDTIMGADTAAVQFADK